MTELPKRRTGRRDPKHGPLCGLRLGGLSCRIPSGPALPTFAELASQRLTAARTGPYRSRGMRWIQPLFRQGKCVGVFLLLLNPQFRLERGRWNRLRHLLVECNTADIR